MDSLLWGINWPSTFIKTNNEETQSSWKINLKHLFDIFCEIAEHCRQVGTSPNIYAKALSRLIRTAKIKVEEEKGNLSKKI